MREEAEVVNGIDIRQVLDLRRHEGVGVDEVRVPWEKVLAGFDFFPKVLGLFFFEGT